MERNLFLNTITWFLIFFTLSLSFWLDTKVTSFLSNDFELLEFIPVCSDRCSIIVLFLFPWKKCLKKIVTASIKISSLCFFFFFFLRQILFKKNRYRTFFSFLAKILETSIEYFSLYFFKIAAKTLSRAEIENYRPSPSSKKIYLPSEIQLGIR